MRERVFARRGERKRGVECGFSSNDYIAGAVAVTVSVHRFKFTRSPACSVPPCTWIPVRTHFACRVAAIRENRDESAPRYGPDGAAIAALSRPGENVLPRGPIRAGSDANWLPTSQPRNNYTCIPGGRVCQSTCRDAAALCHWMDGSGALTKEKRTEAS